MVTQADLTTQYGNVTKLQVEQVDERDQIWCKMKHEDGSEDKWYFTYLDEGATVALAQLQLLRDALERNLRLRLDYTTTSSGSRRFYKARIFAS